MDRVVRVHARESRRDALDLPHPLPHVLGEAQAKLGAQLNGLAALLARVAYAASEHGVDSVEQRGVGHEQRLGVDGVPSKCIERDAALLEPPAQALRAEEGDDAADEDGVAVDCGGFRRERNGDEQRIGRGWSSCFTIGALFGF